METEVKKEIWQISQVFFIWKEERYSYNFSVLYCLMVMFKRRIFILVCSGVCLGSLASAQELRYGELLSLYFGVVGQEWTFSEQKPLLNFTNLKPSNPLYQLLQLAVANQKFPNLKLALPLQNIALESDLASLLSQNFSYQMDYLEWVPLSFEKLKTELQYLQHFLETTSYRWKNQQEDLKNKVVNEVFSLLKRKFINKEKLENLELPTYDQLSDFVEHLEEPHTKYYSPKEGKQFMDMIKGSFAGIGIYLVHKQEGYPEIVSVIENGPAEKAWLMVGDELLGVNGVSFLDYKNLDTFILDLKGKVWTKVQLQIRRKNQILIIEVIRNHIELPLLNSKKKGDLCYLRMYSFDLWAKKKFAKELQNLLPCKSFVFDLRKNPWGVVEEVVGILQSFLPYNSPILTINFPEKQELLRAQGQIFFPFENPTAVLINETTASAAEIFAGVLKHYYPDTVKLIWKKSYGKGSMQEVVEFPEHSVLKYTLAFRNIADQDFTINQKGISPDLVLEDDPNTEKDEVLAFVGLE